jgi:HEAT repeat protein
MELSTVVINSLLIPLLLGSTTLLGAFEGEHRKQESLPPGSPQVTVPHDLAKDLEGDEDGARHLFLIGDEAVPALIRFLSDPDNEKRIGAARALAYIGNREGMRALQIAFKSEKDEEVKSAMSSYYAGGLVGTLSKSDLHFLKSSVETARFTDDDDESAFPAITAALALGMMRRKDSLVLLRKVAKQDVIGSEEVSEAIRWINNPRPRQTRIGTSTSEDDLVKNAVLKDTFFVEGKRDDTSVSELTFNRERNKALVSLDIYQNPRTRYGYDLVLAKNNGRWKVVGIWFAWIA